MTAIDVLSPPLEEVALTERIYAGHLLIFKRVVAMERLIALVERLCREATGDPGCTLAADRPEPAAAARAVEALREAFAADRGSRTAWAGVLEAIGLDRHAHGWDRPCLRVQLPAAAGGIGTLSPHRDTWGSRIPQQINWWAPVYPLTTGRTIAFYPAHWMRPLSNDAAGWRPVRGGPVAPIATEPLDEAAAMPVVIEPGDVLCFSGAHLHASVPNRTDTPRWSVELRTVRLADLGTGRGAPDVDGPPGPGRLSWFCTMADGGRLDAGTPRARAP